jgi:hypothetical protein
MQQRFVAGVSKGPMEEYLIEGLCEACRSRTNLSTARNVDSDIEKGYIDFKRVNL